LKISGEISSFTREIYTCEVNLKLNTRGKKFRRSSSPKLGFYKIREGTILTTSPPSFNNNFSRTSIILDLDHNYLSKKQKDHIAASPRSPERSVLRYSTKLSQHCKKKKTLFRKRKIVHPARYQRQKFLKLILRFASRNPLSCLMPLPQALLLPPSPRVRNTLALRRLSSHSDGSLQCFLEPPLKTPSP
jgi:hypothetical protein